MAVEGVGRAGRAGSALGWQARNEQVTRSVRFESDWVGLGLVTHCDAGDARERGSASAGRRGFPVVSMDAEKSEHRVGGWERVGGRVGGRLGGWGSSRRRRGVVFFQSSNLLNLFFPRNVAAVSKLLIAIGKVEPMGRGRGVELNGARRGRVRERESVRGWLERGQAGTKRAALWRAGRFGI